MNPFRQVRFGVSRLRAGWERFFTFEELEAGRTPVYEKLPAAEQHAGQAERRAARLAGLGRNARRQQARAEELTELERLDREKRSPCTGRWGRGPDHPGVPPAGQPLTA
jgi:hypothetical protein